MPGTTFIAERLDRKQHPSRVIGLVRITSIPYAHHIYMRALRRVLLPVLCAIFIVAPSFRATKPLAGQLSDDSFWQLVTDFSEPGGGFLSENLVSNELGYPYIMAPLLERVPPGGVYLGVGPEQNFTYVAALHPSMAFVVDIRRQNMIEHLFYKALFELSENRAQFLSRLFARKPARTMTASASVEELFAAFSGLPEDSVFYGESLGTIRDLLVERHHFALSEEDNETLSHVYEEFAKRGADARYSVSDAALNDLASRFRVFDLPVDPNSDSSSPGTRRLNASAVDVLLGMPFPTYAEVMKAGDTGGRQWSYLATEESYQTVRGMQQKNLIVPVVGDFAGPRAVRAVGQYLKDHDASVAAFYVSNVEQYLTPLPKLQSFYANVATLPLTSASTFIRSSQIAGPQPGLAQSSTSSIQRVLDAVLEGRVRNWNDILQFSNPQ